MEKLNKGCEKICVKCFGNFEAFYCGQPIHFRYKKTKELMAYLVHKEGARCSTGELIGILYEDRIYTKSLQSQIRNLISDLDRTILALGSQSIIHRSYGALAILPELIRCDYYELKQEQMSGHHIYMGEYMSQYSWAEDTAGYLDRLWLWNTAGS